VLHLNQLWRLRLRKWTRKWRRKVLHEHWWCILAIQMEPLQFFLGFLNNSYSGAQRGFYSCKEMHQVKYHKGNEQQGCVLHFRLCFVLWISPLRADGGGKTPDPALRRVCEFLRPQHAHHWAGSLGARRPLLWLQRPRPGGEGGVIIKQLVLKIFFKHNNVLIDLWCFPPSVKSRPEQSSLSTGSSRMSAGPSIVWSPAWTGPPRSFFCLLFAIEPTVEHISQSSIRKLFAIIKMSILKMY